MTGAPSDPSPGARPHRYEIVVAGRLGETIRSAFPGLRAEGRDEDTVLTIPGADQAALYGVLAEAEALGLELLEVRRTTATGPEETSPSGP
ncbi:MAG: hypothetical protein ACRDNK_13455 [Solirubrobacteraceae bacterium]